jgi:hypothetical protein
MQGFDPLHRSALNLDSKVSGLEAQCQPAGTGD